MTSTVSAAPLADDAPAATSIGLVLLGAPALEIGTRRLVLSAKDAALLCLAALAGPIRVDRLGALLWPASTARQADTSLRQRLYRLRREAGAPLVAGGALLQLSAHVHTDLPAALERIARDEHAAIGELLGDHDYAGLPELAEWLQAQRRDWRARCSDALAAAAARCEHDGALARGLVYAQQLVAIDPLAEHAQRRLMRLHYLRGDRASAIAAFERFEQRLKDELGARPSAETIELMATIERAVAPVPARRPTVPASLLRPPRLIGRRRELAALQHAWANRRAFLLVGEAGIGKSRLLRELIGAEPGAAGPAEVAPAEVATAEVARVEVTRVEIAPPEVAPDGIVAARSRPGDAGIAYATLARLLRAVLARHPVVDAPRSEALALVLPELGHAAALAGEAQRLLLQRAVQATLADATAHGLIAVVVDDLHFADDASIDLLQSLVESATLADLQWGFAMRPVDAAAAVARLKSALEESGRVETTVVDPLDAAELAALVASLGLAEFDVDQLASALLRHTGGNPMFALETLKDLVLRGSASGLASGARLPQPVSVGALVERRLGQLSSEALRLARVAALTGPDFSAELAVAVLEAHPLDIAEPWRELETAQVFRDGAFAHDIVFEATRASVPEPIARLLHRRIALQLEARAALPDSVAPHWAGAAEWQRAGAAYAAAARRAQGASQRSHEVECWRVAADAFDRCGDADAAFDARCDSVHATIVVRGVTHAATVIDALLAAARSDKQRAAALTAKATAALMAADHPAGIAAAVQAAALARGFDSPWPGFEAGRLHAVGLAQAGRAKEALAVIEPYRALVEGDASVEQRGHFWADYAYVLNASRRLRDTAFALRRAIENAEALGDIAELATLTSNLATVQGNLGDVGDALALAHRSLALQEQLGTTDGPEGAVVQTYVGLYCGMSGRYGEALERLDAAIASFQRDRQVLWIAVASNHKAQILIELGQPARAQQTLAYEAPSIDHVRARGATLAARLERSLGRSGAAHMERALAELSAGADPHVRMHVLLESAIGDDDARRAIERCDEVVATASALEFAGVALKARLLRARALSRAGDVAPAAAAMRELTAQLATLQPSDLYVAEAWHIATQVFEASGDGDEALLAAAQGAQWIRRVAVPHVPEAFRAGFLERNATNRALLAAADRRLLR